MRVLIARVGAMGDVLHALPAVTALRAAQPTWQIDWVVDPRWRPLLLNENGEGPVVNRVHLAETKLWSRAPFSLNTVRSVAALRRELRAGHYDIAVDMQGTLRSAVLAWLSGAPVRAGYGDPRERPAARFYTQRVPRHAAHVVEQGYELLSAALAPMPGKPQMGAPIMCSTAADDRARYSGTVEPLQDGEGVSIAHGVPDPLPVEPWAENWAAHEVSSAPLCLIAPGAGWGAKQWPATNFAALARALQEEGFDVVVTAPRADNELAGRVLAESGGTARLLVCNVAGLLAITRRASLVVGGDSGPVHLAALLGRPSVALFGPTDPARNGPWGPGPMCVLRDSAAVTSYRHTASVDASLARIPVEEVLRACLKLLGRLA